MRLLHGARSHAFAFELNRHKGAGLFAVGNVEQTDFTVGSCRRHGLAIRTHGDGVDAAVAHVDLGNFFHVIEVKLVELDGLSGVQVLLGDELLDVIRNFPGQRLAENDHLPLAIEAAAGGEHTAIGAVAHAENAPGHFGELADEVGVVTNLAGGLAEDAEYLRCAV